MPRHSLYLKDTLISDDSCSFYYTKISLVVYFDLTNINIAPTVLNNFKSNCCEFQHVNIYSHILMIFEKYPSCFYFKSQLNNSTNLIKSQKSTWHWSWKSFFVINQVFIFLIFFCTIRKLACMFILTRQIISILHRLPLKILRTYWTTNATLTDKKTWTEMSRVLDIYYTLGSV